MSDHIRTRVIESSAELRSIGEDWRHLFDSCCAATPFQSPAWLLHWIEVFAPKNLRVIEFRDDTRLVALAPLLIYGRGSEQVLAFAGGGVSDYLNLLCAPGYEQPVLQRLVDAIERQSRWTILDLTDLPKDSLFLSAARPAVREHDTCSVLTLPSSQNGLLQVFSKRQRANLRNARSRMKRSGGGTVEVACAETLSECLEDLFRLHTDRWSRDGEDGVLRDERVRDFHRKSAPQLLAHDLLRMFRLRVSGRTVAVLYTLVQRETVFCYMQGYELSAASFSPGTQLMYAVMSDAIERKMRRFDFLRGDEGYKQHWRPAPEKTYRVELERAALHQLSPVYPRAA